MEPAGRLSAAVLRFGPFEADLRTGQLRKHGVKLKLADQSFRLLVVLLERAGEVVTREDLKSILWPESRYGDFESSLNTAVLKLRRALAESPGRPVYLETLPKRGYRFTGSLSRGSAPRPRLVVLPSLNLIGDPGQEHIANCLTEELTGALAAAASGELSIIARTTAMQYKRGDKTVARIGRELTVDYVVESSVLTGGDDGLLIAVVQLIRVHDEAHVCAGRWEFRPNRPFGGANFAAKRIAEHFGIKARAERPRPTEDDIAYNLYIRARYDMFRAGPVNWLRVKELLERAVTRDPRFAPAYIALAELHWHAAFFGWVRPIEACAAGMCCAARALEIDNTSGEAHALLGMFRLGLDFDWAGASREIAIALQLAPSSPLVKMWYAVGDRLPADRLDDAAEVLQSALEDDPLNPVIRAWFCMVLWAAREDRRAIDQAHFLLEFQPDSYFSPLFAGVVYREQGKYAEAIAWHRQAVELSGHAPIALIWLGVALAQAGELREARANLDRLLALRRETYIAPTGIAWNFLALRDHDAAFEWLNRAIDDRDYMIVGIKSFSLLAPLRSDPRFLRLLRRMNPQA